MNFQVKQSRSVLDYLKQSLLLLLTVPFLAGCAYKERDELRERNAQLEAQLQEKDASVNSLLETFNEIDANLASIREKEGMIAMNAEGKEIKAEKKQKILNDIQAINTLMEENRQKIASLQENLEKSGLQNTKFQKKLKALSKQLEEREKELTALKENLLSKDVEIAGLNTTLGNLSSQIDTLNLQVQDQMGVIQTQDTELNKTFYTAGTYKELKEKGIIERDGWTPWTGKKLDVTDQLPKKQFTAIDKREVQSIPLNTKKAHLVSDHPEGSYDFKETSDGMVASLDIKNPEEFWSVSKYLVVEVK